MGTPTPSADAPIDPSRIEFGHDEKSGYFSGDTASRNDPSGKQPKVPVQEAIGKVSAAVEASGPVTAELDPGTNTAQVHSSWVKMNADVTLKPNVDPDPANFKMAGPRCWCRRGGRVAVRHIPPPRQRQPGARDVGIRAACEARRREPRAGRRRLRTVVERGRGGAIGMMGTAGFEGRAAKYGLVIGSVLGAIEVGFIFAALSGTH